MPDSFRSLAPAQPELELAPLLNRHLKTSLRFRLGGRTVWFSGAFDASQTVYVCVLVEGEAPAYFNAKDLLNADRHLSFSGAHYTLSLSPNIFRKMNSTISLKNDANARDVARFSVQGMLDAVSIAGLTLQLSGQSYKFYYADAVDQRMFIFICGDSPDFQVFLIPENQVPADHPGVFALADGSSVGLSRRGERLRISPNP